MEGSDGERQEALRAAETALHEWQQRWDAYAKAQAEASRWAEVERTKIEYLEKQSLDAGRRRGDAGERTWRPGYLALVAALAAMKDEHDQKKGGLDELAAALEQRKAGLSALREQQRQQQNELSETRKQIRPRAVAWLRWKRCSTRRSDRKRTARWTGSNRRDWKPTRASGKRCRSIRVGRPRSKQCSAHCSKR